jgi:hypothetical protein
MGLAKARDAAKVRLVNTSTHTNSAARDAGHPLNRLRHHITAAVERGDAIAIVERPATTSERHTLKGLLSITGHHCQPYGGGVQVFHEPGATEGDPRYWSLADAHVVGTLSGPSLHIVTTETVAAFNASQHTPEPWHHSADLPQHGCRLIHAADGYLVADAGRITRRTGAEMDSNARRIVACVNACAGMGDPAAEIAALRGMLADAALQLARLTGPALETYARTFAALAGKGDK